MLRNLASVCKGNVVASHITPKWSQEAVSLPFHTVFKIKYLWSRLPLQFSSVGSIGQRGNLGKALFCLSMWVRSNFLVVEEERFVGKNHPVIICMAGSGRS